MPVGNRIAVASVVLLILTTRCVADGVEAFWQAARDGDTDQIKRLLDAGVDVNAVTEFNCGAMYFAANRNQADVIRALVEAGGDVNLRDTDYHFTPVQMAAWLGHTAATKALIDAGASPSDTIGSCFAAASNGHAETVKLIIEELDFSQSQLNALWSTANGSGHQNVCELLVNLGAKPPEKTESPAAEDSESTVASAQAAFDFSTDRPLPIIRPANWPEFRGPDRSGIADGQHPPIAFDRDPQKNVLWSRPIQGLGLSSPIIWDQKIYITTATSEVTEQTVDDQGRGWIDAISEDVPHEWTVLCLDLKSGQPIWEKTVTAGTPRSRRHWKASQANPTCATNFRDYDRSDDETGMVLSC